jgi:dipeptide/tripeptide permease
MFLPHPIFWALVQQQSSRWVFQASKMDGDLGFYLIKPDQLTVMVPIFVVMLIPTFDKFLYPLLEKFGIESPLQKMTCGMFCACASFLISAFLETQIEVREISIFWLIPQYILIAAAEILVWVSSLTFAYTQAPLSMRLVMNSCVYLTVAGGNIIVFIISGAQIFNQQFYEFLFFACLMFIDCLVFIALAVKYQYVGESNANKIQV